MVDVDKIMLFIACCSRFKSHDEVTTNWMGYYFALIGDRLLHSENGDTCCKLALQLISNGNHKDGSRMLCQYLETILDVPIEKLPVSKDTRSYEQNYGGRGQRNKAS